MIFTCYNDPAHGWLQVKRSLLNDLGIAHKITRYSYQHGDFVYLEEDCDASLLIKALEKRGIEYKLRDRYSNRSSKIRSYESYEYLTDADLSELANLKQRMLGYANWNEKTKAKVRNAGLATLKCWQRHYSF